MAASELIQAHNELASRVSSHFIAARLVSASQQDQEARANQQQAVQAKLASSPPGISSDQRHQATSDQPIQMPNQSNSEKQQQQHPKHHQDQWPGQQLQPARHEDSDSSTASEHDLAQYQGGSPRAGLSPVDQGDKSRVGPMGIFFKVWSLVKVTKSRHNRMKRQISEAADQQQFQYIPGDQFGQHSDGQQIGAGTSSSPLLALPRGSFNQQSAGQRHLLQDAHFRRAGSQPPISSHAERRALHLDPVGQLQIGTTNGIQNTHSATGTTSSSSGVSSTTSSTLATNYTAAAAAAAAAAADGPPQARGDPTSQRGSGGGKHNNETSPLSCARPTGSQSSGRSWTTRIKSRGSTGVPAAPQPPPATNSSSYASRYRAQRTSLDKRQSMQLVESAAGSPSAADVKRQLRAQSEVKQLEELRKKAIAIAKSSSPAALIGTKSKMSLQRFRPRPRQDSVSDEAEGDEDDEEDEEDAARAGQRQFEPEDEDDSDLNDIYSTPNDSIQSVPSGQLMLEQSNRHISAGSGGNHAHQSKRLGPAPKSADLAERKTSQGSYHMTKSFSANYFSQLTETSGSANNSKRRIDEPKLAGSTILEAESGSSKRQVANGVRANGSRFFISSSSSEDSNPPPPQAQSAATLTSGNLNSHLQMGQSASSNQQQQQPQIPITSGLHYHGPRKSMAPAASRPNSLAVASPSQLFLLQPHQPSVMTPNTLIVNGGSFEPTVVANVAAMSPMLCGLPGATNLEMNSDVQQGKWPNCQLVTHVMSSGYKKSPSLFDMNSSTPPASIVQRFSSKYPWARRNAQRQPMSSFIGVGGGQQPQAARQSAANDPRSPRRRTSQFSVPNSISLHDCKLASAKFGTDGKMSQGQRQHTNEYEEHSKDCAQGKPLYQAATGSEYRLTQMLLELGSNPAAKDDSGCTALMHAIMSENLPAFRCLVEYGVDLNDTNHMGQSALDLICNKEANDTRLEMLKLMINNQVDLDQARKDDGSRLLDRLIREHEKPNRDKIPFIECLLHNGAKLGSSTWTAARGKHEIQLKLLRKLCQDGYFLYKKSSIEAAVFRFEYALKRIDELEQQVLASCRQACQAKCHEPAIDLDEQQAITKETQQAKYQTFLGLSRCERKRGFFKRALEFADMSILIDSTSYEGYYSKAHILKDIGEKEDAILTIDQTERLVSKSIEIIKGELSQLDIQEESLVFDGCFNMHDPNKSSWIEATRIELNNNLDYLTEAKRHVLRLRGEIINDQQS